ncbi:sensor histidine kinase [Paenibacillus sp. MMO-58]|uniref:sensor histidine kinase n=1 Tax=Paenibacillus sp. MMO-58 TaxID=3081290 RepID=UPI003017B98A
MPIKYKLALWTTSLILILFIVYTIAQYNAVTQWMMNSQKDSMRRTAAEIIGYFSEQEEPLDKEGLEESRGFLQRFVQNNQLLRLLDPAGREVMILTRELPSDWVPVQTAESESIVSLHHGQDRLMVVRAPINTTSFKGTLELAANLENEDAMKDRLRSLMLELGALGIIFSTIGGLVVAWRLLKPLNRMASAMNDIKRTGVSGRVRYRNNGDEISRLSSIFNEMMEELERSFNRQRQFIEDASHEIRTPIAIIEGHMKLLKRWGKNNPAIQEESIAAVIEEIVRLRQLTNQLLDLSGDLHHPAEEISDPIDPSNVVMELIQNYRLLYPHFTIVSDLKEGKRIRIDEHRLHQVLIILLDNAVRYSSQNPVLRISLKVVGENIHISVEDKGIGIHKKDIPYIFDRFFRVDKGRGRKEGGNGLGLSIAKKITEKYGGEIRIISEMGIGTTVILIFPHA